MSINYKDELRYSFPNEGVERREDIAKISVDSSTLNLKTLKLEDYDKSFKEWVDKNLEITFEDRTIPTIALFANQRFGEYMQSWVNTDEKRNLMMNFKVITRENNPQPGTMYGNIRNVPNNEYYTTNQIESIDENGRPLLLVSKMKQPYCVDINYNLTIVTNKYRLLNVFNEMINERFKSINAPLMVNGNIVTMILDSISDESDYQMDDRQYYAQKYVIKVRGFIIREEDYKISEVPKVKINCIERPVRKHDSWAEIEEREPVVEENAVFKGIDISIQIDKCSREFSFTMDEHMVITDIIIEHNMKRFELYVNNVKKISYNRNNYESPIDIRLKPYDFVEIKEAIKVDFSKGPGKFILRGYNPFKTVDN